MKARPVTQAGSDRPERKKSMRVGHRSPGHDPDAEDEDEVERDDDVVDGVGVDEGACGGQTRQSVHAISPFVGRRLTLAQGPRAGRVRMSGCLVPS